MLNRRGRGSPKLNGWVEDADAKAELGGACQHVFRIT